MICVSVARTPRQLLRVLSLAAGLVCLGVGANAEVTISDSPTKGMKCAKNVCRPKNANANLNVTDLANMLAAGDVTVASSSAALDILFAAPLSWTSTSRLTLDSYRSIAIQQPITVAGAGALTLTTNDGGATGDYSFGPDGHVAFWDLKSSLVINAGKYTLVSRIAQLAKAVTKDPSGSYALAQSYNARHDGTYPQAPISGFAGSFEGLGNEISNFSLNVVGNAVGGLFDANSGEIRDISLLHVDLAATPGNEVMGALVGKNYGTVRGAGSAGKIVGNVGVSDVVGGLVGENVGTVADSHSSATVVNGAWSGGLVGFLLSQDANATIVRSYATGNVSGSYSPGGLVGGSGNTTESIVDSFATGAVDNAGQQDNTGGSVGGLVGGGGGSIVGSYATGNVTGGKMGYVGGLVGAPDGSIDRSFSSGRVSATGECTGCGGLTGAGALSITNSYSTSSITVPTCDACGGLVGIGFGMITTSYSVGRLKSSGPGPVGGFIGYDGSNPGTLADTYWDLDTSGIGDTSKGAGNVANDQGITGLTDKQLKSKLPSGFDPNTWGRKKSINNGYPYLLANPPPN